jgi:hypothetical protein
VISSLQESIFKRRRESTFAFHVLQDAESPLLYRGDPHCLKRIVENLLSNAAKFTSVGSVDVSVSSEDDSSLTIVVSDTGMGMPAEIISNVREHFDHGESMAVYEQGNVGVGLSLVTEMVRLLKGVITVESAVRVGSSFTVKLPFEPVYYPWSTHRPVSGMKIVDFCVDEKNERVTVNLCRFYGIDLEIIHDVRLSLTFQPVAVFFVECLSGGDEFAFLEDCFQKGFFQGTVVACLTDLVPPPMSRKVELFSKPLKPEIVRAYCIKLARGSITDQSTFHKVAVPVPKDL